MLMTCSTSPLRSNHECDFNWFLYNGAHHNRYWSINAVAHNLLKMYIYVYIYIYIYIICAIKTTRFQSTCTHELFVMTSQSRRHERTEHLRRTISALISNHVTDCSSNSNRVSFNIRLTWSISYGRK